MRRLFFIPLFILVGLSACNKKQDFPDYKYQTVYFAYQYPVRTIELGEDENINTDLDNAHKCQIYAAMGGAYASKSDINISITVDNSPLGTGLLFGTGLGNVVAMPSNYYTLASDKIIIAKGAISGGVNVQLTDAFFADPNSIKNNYVIPLKMTSVVGADSILTNKNFVLYALKYVNPWHGNYLRRGKDIITGSVNQTLFRHPLYVEQDEVDMLSTSSMTTIQFPVVYTDNTGNKINVVLLLKIDSITGLCTITSGTSGVTASGNGSFVKKGDKISWGGKDRDALFLNYQVGLASMNITTADTLVMRDRAVAMETFSPVVK